MAAMPDGCVDLVVTDPPYKRESLLLFGNLAIGGQRVMKDKSWLVTLCGHYQIPEVLSLMCPHLDYHWMGSLENRSYPRLFGVNFMVTWKPILYFRKGKATHKVMCDGIPRTRSPDQTKHPWAQNMTWATHLIENLSDPSALIFDPFIGSGTTAVAADRLDRKFFGCDINPDYVKMSLDRIGQDRLRRSQLTLL